VTATPPPRREASQESVNAAEHAAEQVWISMDALRIRCFIDDPGPTPEIRPWGTLSPEAKRQFTRFLLTVWTLPALEVMDAVSKL
jgi:hypothetical protein